MGKQVQRGSLASLASHSRAGDPVPQWMVLSAAPKAPCPASSIPVLTSQPFLSLAHPSRPRESAAWASLCIPLGAPSRPDPCLGGPPSTCLSALAKLSSALPPSAGIPCLLECCSPARLNFLAPQVPLWSSAASAVTRQPSFLGGPTRPLDTSHLPWGSSGSPELGCLLPLRASWPGCEPLCFGALGAEPGSHTSVPTLSQHSWNYIRFATVSKGDHCSYSVGGSS